MAEVIKREVGSMKKLIIILGLIGFFIGCSYTGKHEKVLSSSDIDVCERFITIDGNVSRKSLVRSFKQRLNEVHLTDSSNGNTIILTFTSLHEATKAFNKIKKGL